MTGNPDRLLRRVLILTMIPFVTVWLPLIRGLMDGVTYEWGASLWGVAVGGRGIENDYWILPILAAFSITLLYFGWRGARQPFHWLLLIWNIPNAIEAVYNAIRFPERYRFQGDTLGVDISLAWVGPLFWGGLALLSLLWVIGDLRRGEKREAPRWQRKNTILLAIVVGLLPVQFFLLRFGEPHGTTDAIGVILTMGQWVLLNLSLKPWPAKTGMETGAGLQAVTGEAL